MKLRVVFPDIAPGLEFNLDSSELLKAPCPLGGIENGHGVLITPYLDAFRRWPQNGKLQSLRCDSPGCPGRIRYECWGKD